MRVAGTDSWSFEEAESQMLEAALYTRDAANLAAVAAADIPPPLRGEVSRRDELVSAGERDIISRLWAAWWRRLIEQVVADEANSRSITLGANAVEQPEAKGRVRSDAFDPPEFRSLTDVPVLRAAVVATYLEGRRWFNGKRPNLPSGDYFEVAEGRWLFKPSEPDLPGGDSHELLPAPRDPNRGASSFERRAIRHAAERTAEEHGVPLRQVRAMVHVLDVQGLWSYLPSPGCAICSVSVSADPDAAERLLLEVFSSSVR